MTPEAQRIAIAEACGWKKESDRYYIDGLRWTHPMRLSVHHKEPVIFATCDLPDYLNDLNAMHEAEQTLCDKHGNMPQRWYDNLINHCCGSNPTGMRASAIQRAEAFLRTIGKWTDTDPKAREGG